VRLLNSNSRALPSTSPMAPIKDMFSIKQEVVTLYEKQHQDQSIQVNMPLALLAVAVVSLATQMAIRPVRFGPSMIQEDVLV
jgi:hypothetical protein